MIVCHYNCVRKLKLTQPVVEVLKCYSKLDFMCYGRYSVKAKECTIKAAIEVITFF